MFKPQLYAVVAMSALLTACQGGQALPPPPAGAQVQPSSNDREFTSLSLFEAQNVATGEKVRVFPTKDAMDAFRTAQAGQRAAQAMSLLTLSRRRRANQPEDVRRVLGLLVEYDGG